MPCYTVQTTRTLGKLELANLPLVAAAFRALGYRNVTATEREVRADANGVAVTFTKTTGLLTATGRGNLQVLAPTTLKQAYARECVRLAARKFGWNLEEQSATDFVATRSGF